MISNLLQKHKPNKSGIVGKPTGGELAIFSDNGVIQKPGVVSDVSIQGPNVTNGY